MDIGDFDKINRKELYQPCDLILIQRPITSLDLIPFFIQIRTLCRWNHIGLAITNTHMIHSHGKDKLGRFGVTVDKIDSIAGRKQILRFKGLTGKQGNAIIYHALMQNGKKFNWLTFLGLCDANKKRVSCQDIINNAFTFAGIELNYWKPRDFLYDEGFEIIKGMNT